MTHDFYEAEELEERLEAVTDHLLNGLRTADRVATKLPERHVSAKELQGRPSPLTMPAFDERRYLNAWTGFIWGLVGTKGRAKEYARNRRLAEAWQNHYNYWTEEIAKRERQIESFDQAYAAKKQDAERFNQSIRDLQASAREGDRSAQWEYSKLLLGEYFTRQLPGSEVRTSLSFDSRRVVLEVEAPRSAVVPREKSVRMLKTTGEIRYSYRTDADVRRLYSSFLAQVTLGSANAVFALCGESIAETVVVNLFVNAPDPGTGRVGENTLISVMASRDEFDAIDLAAVDPVSCLKHLNAAVSRNPSETVPVRPFASVDKSDVRFIGASDLIGELDSRPNLMELSPTEFESLVQNLFEKMGLDTRQTRASRDGGVDAVAFDPRPIIGGKIVIQAKRYKNQVGVSAVRDLYGTLQNEGGSKGILVTTSGYGKGSYEFAKNKPLELIDGGELLFLLKEHTGIEARIVVPEDWRDPTPD
ncbi:MAG: restriction endonuclease [Microcella sp.]